MDNEGLLEWAEYEVEKAQAVLDRAIKHAEQLQKVVADDKNREAYNIDTLVIEAAAAEGKRRGAAIREAENLESKLKEAESTFWVRFWVRSHFRRRS